MREASSFMRIYSYIARLVRERPWLVVAVSLLVTLAIIPGLFFINGEVTQKSMLPPDFPSNKALKDLTNVFGGTSYEQASSRRPR